MDLVFVLRALAVVAILGALVVAGAYFVWSGSIRSDMDRLVASARAADAKPISAERIASLPPPASRYFTRAGVIGTIIPRVIRLAQKGRIRSSAAAGWMQLEAEEVYSTDPPAFIWRAGMPGLNLPVVLGRDEYLDGEGSIAMKMGALIPVAEERGAAMRAAGLMRYLNEMMWFPAAYLGHNVTILPVDDASFAVRMVDGSLVAEGRLFIDPEGRLTNFRAIRYNTGTQSEESWETPVSAWDRLAGLELPTRGAADWKLFGGDLRYIELEITSVTYEQ